MVKPPASLNLVPTEDGSLSLRDADSNELYHNRAGAYTEALRSYVEPSSALQLLKETGKLKILDACFGLGYNSFVTIVETLKSLSQAQESLPLADIHILAIEKNAAVLSLIPHILDDIRFSPLRCSSFGSNSQWPSKFGTYRFDTGRLKITLDIVQSDLQKAISTVEGDFDLIFHDPFSPQKCPELWTVDLFQHYYRLCQAQRGAVLTYSSAYAVRGGFIEAGFRVWQTTGVGNKSGGTLAQTSNRLTHNQYLFPLTTEQLAKISTRSGTPYRDPLMLDCRQQIRDRREAELAVVG